MVSPARSFPFDFAARRDRRTFGDFPAMRATELDKQRYNRFGAKFRRIQENGEGPMMSIRRSILVAGAAAFLSSQAAYAAPTVSPVDPLVSLAILGGAQSHSAVCAGSTAAAAAAAAAAQGAAPGCVLPITSPPPPVAEGAPPPPPVVEAAAPKSIGTLPLLLGLAALIAVAALIISNNHHGNGNVTPVSPV